MRGLLAVLLAGCTNAQPGSPPTVSVPTGQPDRLRLVAVGDAGEGNATQRRVARAIEGACADRTDASGPGCDLVLYLGDNFYQAGLTSPDDPQGQSKFLDAYGELSVPLWAVLGNHDYGRRALNRDRAAQQLAFAARHDAFGMPARFYRLDAGPATLLALDTNALMLEGLWGDSGQRAWVEDALSQTEAPWRVLFGHHPFRSNGQHGNAGTYEGTRLLPVASGRQLDRFFTETMCGQADLYLSAHDHNRQWLEPTCGVELVVSGAGAKHTPLVGRGAPTLFEDDIHHGFVWLELRPEGLSGAFYRDDGSVDFTRAAPRPAGR